MRPLGCGRPEEGRNLGFSIAWVILGALALFVIFKGLQDFSHGGNNWKQGDWLINSDLVEVRRGLFGSAMLKLFDMLNLRPIHGVILVQLAAALAFFALLLCLARRIACQTSLLALMFLPPFVLMFWANDPQGSLRKELLMYLALAFVALSNGGSRSFFFIGAVVGAVSFLGHEVNILLAPAFLMLLWYSRGPIGGRAFAVTAVPVVLVMLFSALYTVRFHQASDLTLVCEPLTRRGVPVVFCDGAMSAIGLSSADGRRLVMAQLNTRDIALFGAIYLGSGLAWLHVARRYFPVRQVIVLFGLPVLGLLPLYLVAVDYGRWMSLHFTVATMLLVGRYLAEMPVCRSRPLDMRVIYVIAFVAILLSPRHTLGRGDGRAAVFVIPAVVALLAVRQVRSLIRRPR